MGDLVPAGLTTGHCTQQYSSSQPHTAHQTKKRGSDSDPNCLESSMAVKAQAREHCSKKFLKVLFLFGTTQDEEETAAQQVPCLSLTIPPQTQTDVILVS